MSEQPTSVPADGSVKVVFVSALADTAEPLVAEATAAGAIDLSCYLTADGLNMSTDEQTITDDRLCSRQTFEQPGRFSDAMEVGYVYDPQNAVTTEDLAYKTLKRGVKGFLIIRWGADYEAALTAGDVVDVVPVTWGIQRKQTPEANSVLKVMQKPFITGSVQRDVEIVAA